MELDWRDSWWDLMHGSRCLGCQRPGRVLCPACAALLPSRGGPVRPDPAPPGLVPCAAAGEYADTVRAVLLAHKEHGVYALARPLAGLLAAAVESLGVRGPEPVVLVPMPTRARLARRRGHDPVGRVASRAARVLRARGLGVHAVPLLRLRFGVADQASLTATERAVNIAGSMAARARPRQALAAGAGPVRVIVCDDVITTGATAREAQRALQSAGIPVFGVAAIAATRRRGRGRGPAVGPRARDFAAIATAS